MNQNAEEFRNIEVLLILHVETGTQIERTPESSPAYDACQEAHTASLRAIYAAVRAYGARRVADELAAC